MKKVVLFFLIFCMIFTTSISTYAEDNGNKDLKDVQTLTLTLKEAVEYSLKHSKDIKIQKLEFEKAKEEYDKYYDPAKKGAQVNIGVPSTRDPKIDMQIYIMGAESKVVDLMFKKAKLNNEIIVNKVTYDTEKAFYDLIQSKESLVIAEEGVKLAQKQYDQSTKMFQLGTISSQQLIASELGLYQAQAGYDSALAGYELTNLNFNDIIGLPLNLKVEVDDNIVYSEQEIDDLNVSIESALKKNGTLRVMEDNHKITKLKLDAAKYVYYDDSDADKYKDTQIEYEISEKNLQSAKNNVEISIRSAHINLINLQKQIKTYETAVKKAQKNQELTQLGFELGNNTPNEVIQANIELMNAKQDLSKKIHAYNLAYLDFKYGIGIGKELIR